jgi:hypothetical protein
MKLKKTTAIFSSRANKGVDIARQLALATTCLTGQQRQIHFREALRFLAVAQASINNM